MNPENNTPVDRSLTEPATTDRAVRVVFQPQNRQTRRHSVANMRRQERREFRRELREKVETSAR